ncbi:hypothetical protein IGI04_003230 [Brassica rapa subsp. trilocularis]|uniref:Uncharacterized protein n=1 Tax=Brassica rapa subsp. trilocularis TaxID=1813537 RepID=A0ABQ7NXU8_BRACM|nr:hypothetical protein IGI04_000128 [Brassica rapa subsp. trilocularis]KAG5415663.1 hypothetical protein IGI04_003230 [Brassica rapa subsp. trilocularis]
MKPTLKLSYMSDIKAYKTETWIQVKSKVSDGYQLRAGHMSDPISIHCKSKIYINFRSRLNTDLKETEQIIQSKTMLQSGVKQSSHVLRKDGAKSTPKLRQIALIFSSQESDVSNVSDHAQDLFREAVSEKAKIESMMARIRKMCESKGKLKKKHRVHRLSQKLLVKVII